MSVKPQVAWISYNNNHMMLEQSDVIQSLKDYFIPLGEDDNADDTF